MTRRRVARELFIGRVDVKTIHQSSSAEVEHYMYEYLYTERRRGLPFFFPSRPLITQATGHDTSKTTSTVLYYLYRYKYNENLLRARIGDFAKIFRGQHRATNTGCYC